MNQKSNLGSLRPENTGPNAQRYGGAHYPPYQGNPAYQGHQPYQGNPAYQDPRAPRGQQYGPLNAIDQLLYGTQRVSTAPDAKKGFGELGNGIYGGGNSNNPTDPLAEDRAIFEYSKRIVSSMHMFIANLSHEAGDVVRSAFERFKHPCRIRGIDPVCNRFINHLRQDRQLWLNNVYPNVLSGLTYLLFYELKNTHKDPSIDWIHGMLEQVTLTCCAAEMGNWLTEQADGYRLIEDLTGAGRDMLENRKINLVPELIKMRQELATLGGVIDTGNYPWVIDCIGEILSRYEYRSEVATVANMAHASHTGTLSVRYGEEQEVYNFNAIQTMPDVYCYNQWGDDDQYVPSFHSPVYEEPQEEKSASLSDVSEPETCTYSKEEEWEGFPENINEILWGVRPEKNAESVSSVKKGWGETSVVSEQITEGELPESARIFLQMEEANAKRSASFTTEDEHVNNTEVTDVEETIEPQTPVSPPVINENMMERKEEKVTFETLTDFGTCPETPTLSQMIADGTVHNLPPNPMYEDVRKKEEALAEATEEVLSEKEKMERKLAENRKRAAELLGKDLMPFESGTAQILQPTTVTTASDNPQTNRVSPEEKGPILFKDLLQTPDKPVSEETKQAEANLEQAREIVQQEEEQLKKEELKAAQNTVLKPIKELKRELPEPVFQLATEPETSPPETPAEITLENFHKFDPGDVDFTQWFKPVNAEKNLYVVDPNNFSRLSRKLHCLEKEEMLDREMGELTSNGRGIIVSDAIGLPKDEGFEVELRPYHHWGEMHKAVMVPLVVLFWEEREYYHILVRVKNQEEINMLLTNPAQVIPLLRERKDEEGADNEYIHQILTSEEFDAKEKKIYEEGNRSVVREMKKMPTVFISKSVSYIPGSQQNVIQMTESLNLITRKKVEIRPVAVALPFVNSEDWNIGSHIKGDVARSAFPYLVSGAEFPFNTLAEFLSAIVNDYNKTVNYPIERKYEYDWFQLYDKIDAMLCTIFNRWMTEERYYAPYRGNNEHFSVRHGILHQYEAILERLEELGDTETLAILNNLGSHKELIEKFQFFASKEQVEKLLNIPEEVDDDEDEIERNMRTMRISKPLSVSIRGVMIRINNVDPLRSDRPVLYERSSNPELLAIVDSAREKVRKHFNGLVQAFIVFDEDPEGHVWVATFSGMDKNKLTLTRTGQLKPKKYEQDEYVGMTWELEQCPSLAARLTTVSSHIEQGERHPSIV